MGRNLIAVMAGVILAGAAAWGQVGPARASGVRKVEPVFAAPAKLELQFEGFVGERLRANLNEWELRAPKANPAMIQMFFDRDRKADRRLLPWSGEFVGKYLCSAILSYKILRDPRQREVIERITNSLIDSQGSDGYLGPFDKENRLTGKNWDIWGHYWVIRALLMYYQEFSSARALHAATQAADLLTESFLDKGIPFTNDGSYGQMNYAVIHALAMLYQATGKPRYLEMANWIVRQWDMPGAGLYMKLALEGKEMYEFPGNRWESLHDFLGMYEMYMLSGEQMYRDAFSHIWYSILKGDRHNTGGFTSGERTTGDPYDPAPIETCCTVAWIDMSIDMLKLTGNSLVADEIELSTLNGNIGGQSPSGSWWTYNTPMDGVKEASHHTINFQCRPGSPDLNCCSVNGPRGLGMVAEWAIMQSQDGFVVNYYGPSTFKVITAGGQGLTLEERTDYPLNGKIALQLGLAKPERFELKLRIPSWSSSTRTIVAGKEVSGVKPGSYLSLAREWKDGDSIVLDLDMSFHYWGGERECYGKTSIYRGPILLAFDPTYNSMDPAAVPELDARDLKFQFEKTRLSIQPVELIKIKAINGEEVTLCDFATAGAYGNYYRTWLPVRNIAPVPFDPGKPVWNNRP